MQCEIMDVRPGAMIQTLATTSDPTQPKTSTMLTYTLCDLGSKTEVQEHAEILEPKLNLLVRILVWLIHRIGKPQGETTLMRLKRIVEEKTD